MTDRPTTYEKKQTPRAEAALEKLAAKERKELERVVKGLCADPWKYERRLEETADKAWIYRHYPSPRFEITFKEIEAEKPTLLFVHYGIKRTQLPRRAFISYSRKDSKYLDELVTLLSLLEDLGKLKVFSDPEIRAGDDWEEEIFTALEEADYGILLVSTDFVGSDFIKSRELPEIKKAVEASRLVLLWIPLRPVPYELLWFTEKQALSDPAKPLTDLKTKAQREAAFTEIVRKINERCEAD